MPRIRTIKPEFPHSESMGMVGRDARLTFVLMWTLADDSGRLRGNSRMLASLLYPYDDDAPGLIDGWISELETQECIQRYVVEGTTYIQIHKWLNHQKIDRPSKSRFPAFDEGSRVFVDDSSGDLGSGPRTVGPRTVGPRTRGSRILDQGPKEKDTPLATQDPQNGGTHTKRFIPPTVDEVHGHMSSKGLDDRGKAEDFCDFYESKGWMVGKTKMKVWRSAASKWARDALQNPKGSNGANGGQFKTKQQLIEESNARAVEEFVNDSPSSDLLEARYERL